MDNLPNEFVSKPLMEPVVARTSCGDFEIDQNGLGIWRCAFPNIYYRGTEFTKKEQAILDYYRGVKRG
jgi:hypothetical protein